jgi:hypothetical protein
MKPREPRIITERDLILYCDYADGERAATIADEIHERRRLDAECMTGYRRERRSGLLVAAMLCASITGIVVLNCLFFLTWWNR